MVLGLPSLRVGNRAGGPHSVQVPRLLQGRKTTEESKRIFLFTRFTGQMLLLLCLLAGTVQVGQAQSTATLPGDGERGRPERESRDLLPHLKARASHTTQVPTSDFVSV